jgi:hypothetical protein
MAGRCATGTGRFLDLESLEALGPIRSSYRRAQIRVREVRHTHASLDVVHGVLVVLAAGTATPPVPHRMATRPRIPGGDEREPGPHASPVSSLHTRGFIVTPGDPAEAPSVCPRTTRKRL